MGVEGVLFLVKRKTAPTYALYILNRLSMDNFCLYLSDIRDLSLADEFLICQTSEGQACGLWLFEEKDRQRFLDRILELRKLMELNSTSTQQMPLPTATAPSNAGQVNILQLFEKASLSPQQKQPVSQKQQQQSNNHATDLLSMLQSGQKGPEQQQQQPHPHQLPHPPPPPSVPSSAAAFFNGYNGFPGSEIFPDNNGVPTRMPQPPPPPPPLPQMFNQSQSSPMQYPSHSLPHQPPSVGPAAAAVIGGNGELNKAYYPAFPPPPSHPAATASPQKAASLLQALQGGGPAQPLQQQSPLPPPGIRQSPRLPDHQRSWPSPSGMYPSPRLGANAGPNVPHPPVPQQSQSLMPQQTLDIIQPEVDRRFGNEGRPPLSKPEFIQQFLNMVQSDSSFLDTLYDRYRGTQGQSQQQQQQLSEASTSSFVNQNRAMPPYHHQM
ncbi:hypothetical protein BDC45DRAFT_103460 [Circinella umbellata]|nr:hypothetical protein BDC45DRAFT_103460 [Circinella umbellata]